jgi:predicted transcriptional regulator
MTRRTCRYCGHRVPVVYDGAAIAADSELVALYDEHDPCPGSYQQVEPPRETPLGYPEDDEPVPMDERPGVLLELVAARVSITVLDAARRLGTSDAVAARVLDGLHKRGRVTRGRERNGTPYRYALACPVPGELARDVWAALLAGPVDPCELAERLQRIPNSVRAALGRMRKRGIVEQVGGRWTIKGGEQ